MSQTFHKMLQNHPKGSVTQLVTFADFSQNRLCPLPILYIVIRYTQQIAQMAFSDLSHTYHRQVTNVSPAYFCHPNMGNFDVSAKPVFLFALGPMLKAAESTQSRKVAHLSSLSFGMLIMLFKEVLISPWRCRVINFSCGKFLGCFLFSGSSGRFNADFLFWEYNVMIDPTISTTRCWRHRHLAYLFPWLWQ